MAVERDAYGRRMDPAVVYLVGYPGAGKYTIARHLAGRAHERGHRVVVVDNHHVNNTVFAVMDVDGVRGLPRRVWDVIGDVRAAVFTAVEELGPAGWSYVFTNVLLAGKTEDEAILDRVARVAAARESWFVPVRLHCAVDELARRVAQPARQERMKWTDPDGVRRLVASHELIDVAGHAASLDLDVTDLEPGDAADAILDHVVALPGATAAAP